MVARKLLCMESGTVQLWRLSNAELRDPRTASRPPSAAPTRWPT
jgi:hypothetical protein